MHKPVILILLFISMGTGRYYAQTTNSPTEEEIKDTLQPALHQTYPQAHKTRLLLIPFEERMYMSDADREIAKGSNLTYDKLVNYFRSTLIIALANRAVSYYECTDLYAVSVKDTVDYLKKVYSSIGYKGTSSDKLSKVKGEDEKKINKGQITVKEDINEKYTRTVISDSGLLDYLSEKFGCTLFIFINMFEIKNDLSDYAAIGTNDYERALKVHFSIINQNGKQVAGEIASANFSSKMNKVDDIIKKTFPSIIDQIIMNIPQPKAIKPSSKKNSKHKKKK